MSQVLKVVVAGPVGAGKSTFIRSLSEIEVVDTDEMASEDIGKELTTVALDFGIFHLDGVAIHLFGTPGQDRFDFVWEVLCEGALGLVLLVSGEHPGQFSKARAILEFITSRIAVPFVVGVTRQDRPRVWEPEEVAEYFGLPPWQVLGLDATRALDCATAVAGLLELIVQPASSSSISGDFR
jgi:signal recognition particle receptor subunit beta